MATGRGGAEQGQVVLRGRFRPGSRVQLVEVAGEHVLRAQGGREVDRAVVGDDGSVEFSKGVKVGGRYFVVGRTDGFPLEVRCRGNRAGEGSTALGQEPVRAERVKLADGSFEDEAPKREKAPDASVAPAPAQHQVPDGVVQRSATARGVATPMDPDETLPYARQEDVPDGVVQASSTETGIATPVAPVGKQEDSKGIVQRSDTETGVQVPIPPGDAVKAKLEQDAAQVKGARGEPVKAAAVPVKSAGDVDVKPVAKPAPRKAAAKKPAAKSSRSGRRSATTTKKEG